MVNRGPVVLCFSVEGELNYSKGGCDLIAYFILYCRTGST